MQRVQCFFIGVIVLILLIALGHVMRLKSMDGNLLLNLSQERNNELKLIRDALTRNDYKDPQVIIGNALNSIHDEMTA